MILNRPATAILSFEGLFCPFPEIYLRFEGLLVSQNASINGFAAPSFRRF